MARQATAEEKEIAAQMEAVLNEENAEESKGANVAGNSPEEKPEGIEVAPVEPPKRKRGRPTDAERALRESLGAPSESSGGAKRGPKPKNNKGDSKTLAKSLVGIHQLAAMVTGIPEAQLSEPEGEALAEAVIAVCEEYGLNIDGKTGAAMQLFGACAMIYGPRVFAFKVRIAQEQVAREKMAASHGQI